MPCTYNLSLISIGYYIKTQILTVTLHVSVIRRAYHITSTDVNIPYVFFTNSWRIAVAVRIMS